MKLRDALQGCTLSLMRRIAESHNLPVQGDTLRGELAEALCARLLEPGYLSGYLGALTSEETRALQIVAAHGWTVKAFLLEREFPRSDAGLSRGLSRGPVSPPLSLLHKGLLFRDFATVGPWRGEVYLVPDELVAAVSLSIPPPPARSAADLRAKDAPQVESVRNAAFDVFCLLSFVRGGDRRFSQGALSRSDLAHLEQDAGGRSSGRAGERYEDRWRFLIHLCLAGGWLRREGGMLRPARRAAQLLAGTHSEVQSRLLWVYLKDRAWSDLARAGRARPMLGGLRVDEATARASLLHYLDETTASSWTDLDAFTAELRANHPDFLREGYSSPAWTVVDLVTGGELHGPESWDPVEGEWVRYVLRGPLFWLGVVSWGLTNGGNEVGFRRMGEAAVPPTESGEAGFAAEISVEGDPERMAAERVDLAVLYRLEPYLELRRHGRPSLYRLTRDSALSGVERGGSWEALEELLRAAVGGTVSTAATSGLREWRRAYGRFSLESGIILQTATSEDAEQLETLPGAASFLQSRLGLQSFRVSPERVWELAELLRREGHLPRIDPAVKASLARWAAGDPATLRESLFALVVVKSLGGEAEMESATRAQRRLEAVLGEEEVEEISRRARSAARRWHGRGPSMP